MTIRRLATVACLILGFALTGVASAQEKVACCNPARCFAEMQETKDLKQKIENDQKQVKAEADARGQAVKDLQAQRDLLKPDSPQFQDADKKFMEEAIKFDTWTKITTAQIQGQQKQQMKVLFDKIVSTTAEVAAAKGIDIVIADQRPDLPENLAQINVDQLRASLNGRSVLFTSPKADISQDVIAALDAKYKASGATAPSPTPAPAPASAK